MSREEGVQDLSEITGFSNELVKKILSNPQTVTHQVRGEWSPTACMQVAKEKLLPKQIKDADAQRTMIIQFLKFYITGNVEDTYDVTDVVLSVASMVFKKDARTSTELVWSEDLFGTENLNFSLEVKSKPEAISTNLGQTSEGSTSPVIVISIADSEITALGSDLKKEATPQSLTIVKLRPEEDVNQLAQKVQPLLFTYTNTATQEFIKHCNGILQRSPASNAPTVEALELYRLLNFTALSMLRATVKTHAQMVTGFLKKQYKINISTFTSPTLGGKFVPPSDACLVKVCSHITKTRQVISSLFAKVVCLSTTGDRDVKAYLDAAVLTHTSWNGLGLLHMIFEICEFFGKTWVELYHLTLLSSTAYSWKAIISFLQAHQSSNSPDMTVPWARVIDDTYFMKMGPRDHPTLSSLLIKSLEYAQGEEGGLEQSVWAQRHYKIVERCTTGAEYILGVLNQENVTVVAGSRESKKLAQIINTKTVTINTETPNTVSANRYDDI